MASTLVAMAFNLVASLLLLFLGNSIVDETAKLTNLKES